MILCSKIVGKGLLEASFFNNKKEKGGQITLNPMSVTTV